MAWEIFCVSIAGQSYPINFVEHNEDEPPAIGYFSTEPIELLDGGVVRILKMSYGENEIRH